MKDGNQIEQETLQKYTSGIYKPETISLSRPSADGPYAERLLHLKFELIETHLAGDVIVDVCCGSGVHLYETARGRKKGVGLDFSQPFIAHARQAAAEHGMDNLEFIQCNVKDIPLATSSVDGAYSLSSLYYVPDLPKVVSEIARILKPGARCLLDLGNERSLNGIACRHYPDLSQLCGVDYGAIRPICEAAGLKVVALRSFQILPMWADKPSWLWPLLHPVWKTILARRVGGRMLDEWISSMPLLRNFAFRHIVVCEKAPS